MVDPIFPTYEHALLPHIPSTNGDWRFPFTTYLTISQIIGLYKGSIHTHFIKDALSFVMIVQTLYWKNHDSQFTTCLYRIQGDVVLHECHEGLADEHMDRYNIARKIFDAWY